jgi:mono/diheme cytochrome c family protein
MTLRGLAALGLVLAGAAQAGPDTPPPAKPVVPPAGAPRFEEQGGEAIYRAVCASCHMPDGRGATGAGAYPALAGNTRLADPGYPITMVLLGRKAMPALGPMLTDRQVADVVTYVRTHLGNDYPGPVAESDIAAARPTPPPP